MELKKLFRLKTPDHNDSSSDKEEFISEETRQRTYHESGFRHSSRNNGNPTGLSISLDAIYAKFENEEKELNEKQRKLKEPYESEKKEKETQIKGLQISLENKEENINEEQLKIEKLQTEIKDIKHEIVDLPQNPEHYGVHAKKGATVKFWIGIGLLIPIALYLFTFYISASYSAFFKEFNPNSTRLESILDPKALTKAWNDGFLEFSFVTLIPFVFLGLGFLIHMFGESKKITGYIKVGLLVIITFIFDAIIAYQIEDKIYLLNKTFDDPPFSMAIAFTKIAFWGIIFAGFIVYIIWGLVFDFVMAEHKEKDHIKNAIKKRQQDILIKKEQIEFHHSSINDLKETIRTIREKESKAHGRIEELQRIIDGCIIPTKEYQLYASEYMQGWITCISEKIRLSQHEEDKLILECTTIYKQHLEKVGVTGNAQNTLFIKTI